MPREFELENEKPFNAETQRRRDAKIFFFFEEEKRISASLRLFVSALKERRNRSPANERPD
jgi:hypothetical protein